jgi:3-oxoacyl-[acyl-carrier-protein] synthase II
MNKEIESKRRVVVTGLGLISPLGLNVEDSWKRLIAGETGIVSIDLPYVKNIKMAGIVKNFNPEIALNGFVTNFKKDLKKISRAVQFSTAAAIEASRDAGLFDAENKLKVDSNNIGVRIGTGIGGATYIAEVAEKLKRGGECSPFDILQILLDRVSSIPSMRLGLKGPVAVTSAACATGQISMIDGYRIIFAGDADLMLVGGAESTIEFTTINMFDSPRALSRDLDPINTRGPFDKKSTGFKVGEGGGVLVLEEKEHAKNRGAEIYAELVGYGDTGDAYHDTAPSGEGAKRAIEKTIKKMGGLPKKGLIYFHAHATGTGGDGVELNAIREEMEKHGHEEYAVSSTKGATAHMLGATGAASAIFAIKALNEGILPPTIHLVEPIDEATGIDLVPNTAKKAKPVLVFANGFGFGGMNGVVGFKIFQE